MKKLFDIFFFLVLLIVNSFIANVQAEGPNQCQSDVSEIPKIDSQKNHLPHDSPVLRKRKRFYFAITNKCNRECPWCSVYSSPKKNTFLSPDQMAHLLPKDEEIDIQLEGGEPTIHPKFLGFIDLIRSHPRAKNLIIVTNGVRFPRAVDRLKEYVLRLGTPLTLKLSINHYLLGLDSGLIDLAKNLKSLFEELGGERSFILNVRLRKGASYRDDESVKDLIVNNGLTSISNIFYIQKYGRAENEKDWSDPFIVNEDFELVNPDGSLQGTDLVRRSKDMGNLP